MTMRNLRILSVLGAVAGLLATAPAHANDVTSVTAEDFYGAAYFQRALEHPQVQKAKGKKAQIAVVAKDLKWKPNKLEAALEKVEGLDGDAIELAEAALRAGLEKSRVKGRIRDVIFNAQEPKHVVVYVRWQGSTSKDMVKEAATIASVVAKETPLVSTLSLAAGHPKAPASNKESVWSAKIGKASMERISPARIEDYADRLYKNLFEGVEEQPF